ncbi:MAG: putative lipopolysaccharide heptosyltransferase III [Proteobacteria bacterium]|nr:putative lipopolysaccharide heptosyltransferase III [Pseudomonadota bacterium]HQR04137.1 putative lipopolysaccharide heptosyltransferase III [Rhodocyclaceae bacterium]
MLTDAIPRDDLCRALIIKLRHHGDVLLASPVLSTLKAAAPRCEVDALVYADTAPMVSGHPALSQLHTIDRRWKTLGPAAQARAEWHLLSTLRKRRYDLVVHLTEHRRGAWLTRLIAPRWSVAPRLRDGDRFWNGSFTHLYAQPGHALRHTVEKNLDALRRLGIDPEPVQRRLLLVPGAAAEARVEALLREQGLAPRGFLHLHPGSRWHFKCWPVDRVAMLAELLNIEHWPLVLTAAPDDAEMEMIAALKARTDVPFIDIAGQISLKELAALTARARLFIGVDSAPMHIAAAMGTPTVALFGPSGDREWGPWQVPHRVVASDEHPCRPCGLDGCGGSKVSDCLTRLPVRRVYAACRELLAS